ncbi:xanthine dehydrogenase family protein molybdopterin-binding subunit [Croceibacterium xixiisoli]
MYNKPDTDNFLDTTAQGLIGAPLDRPEGKLKVTGTACYAAEYVLPDCVEGAFVLAPISAGTVKWIDRASIAGMPGVLGVFADDAMLRRAAQGTAGKAPAQGVQTVDYFGQPVALVVAETFEQAVAAANALQIEYAATDPVQLDFDPEAETTPVVDAREDSAVDQGDLDQAMRDAIHSVDVTYRTEAHAAAAMEPHAAMAEWNDDHLTLRGSYQMIGHNVAELADSLGISEKNVRILAPYVGGGFGSKLGISYEAVAAAIAARELARPVRVVLSRQQVFRAVMRRSETRQHIRLAADAEGRLTGIGHEALTSNLPDEDFAEPVTQATDFLYRGEHRRLAVKRAKIARTPAGSVRAPGEAVGMQALEAAMDELAERVGLDPVELRLRNIPERHPSSGTPYSSRMLAQALEEGARSFGWDRRKPQPCARREGDWWIGMGMASAARVNMMMPAKARVTLTPQGGLVVESDQTDIGTGSYAILGQIAGETLGIPIDHVSVRLGDSALPTGAGSGGSFGAISTGSAVLSASRAIRKTLASRLGCRTDELVLRDGHAAGGNRSASIADLVGEEALVETGRIKPGKTAMQYTQASYGAFFAEVAVNVWTGETRVRRMTGAFGFGRVLNAKTARSQCLGGMVWCIGSALTEELAFDRRDGHLANPDLAEYHVPVHRDVPDLDVILLEERDPAASPLQAKGVGELGICGGAGAICNAIYNACGVRVRSFPMTLDKIIEHLPDPLAN